MDFLSIHLGRVIVVKFIFNPNTYLHAVAIVLLGCTSCRSVEVRSFDDLSEGEVTDAMHMLALQQSAMIYASKSDDEFPPSLGHLVLSDWCDIDDAFRPSEWPRDMPSDFSIWPIPRQIEWINKHTDYVYLLSSKDLLRDAKGAVDPSSEYVSLVQIPLSEKGDWVTLCFMDMHFQVWSYEKADRYIRSQTGHSLSDWAKAHSPGAGHIDASRHK